uniref:NADH-ubiquinone oxidoreductase chain 2 n=1 Tax=Ectrychotes andreae TaxID=204515 RepID=A0A7I6HJM4_9HEMI|nr:NADH dehydrogenase subunit 2 [Ectrychotes andreae]
MNISYLLFMMMLIVSTILTISSESWLGMWMGLEMNLISFIPLLYKKKMNSASESCIIYFLIQSMGSILMLISVLMQFSILSFMDFSKIMNYMLIMSMMIKLGMAPFHFWFIEILNKMQWMDCMILMTWQKIAPLTILSYTSCNCPPMIFMITIIMGAIGGFNQTSIRKIMGFSSINHLGWITICMKLHNNLWIIYLFLYSMIIIMMTMLFNMYSSYYLNQLINMNNNMSEKLLISSLFMSLGGLPPFIGFLPKWMVIQSLITSNSFFILMIMIMSSLILLFFYLRLVSTMMLINPIYFKWMVNYKLSLLLIVMFNLFNMSLPIMGTFFF